MNILTIQRGSKLLGVDDETSDSDVLVFNGKKEYFSEYGGDFIFIDKEKFISSMTSIKYPQRMLTMLRATNLAKDINIFEGDTKKLEEIRSLVNAFISLEELPSVIYLILNIPRKNIKIKSFAMSAMFFIENGSYSLTDIQLQKIKEFNRAKELTEEQNIYWEELYNKLVGKDYTVNRQEFMYKQNQRLLRNRESVDAFFNTQN